MSYVPVQSTTTLYSFSPSTSSSSTLITSYVELHARASKSDSSDASSSSSKSSKSTSDSCDDKQRCQTGEDTNATTIGLSIGIPVGVFCLIIGFFMWRSYRKGKKEAESDNDPDFYGETTILPDYPKKFGGPGVAGEQDDDVSFYSNPFANDSARYPSRVLNHPDMLNQAQNRPYAASTTTRGDPYYETFKLPYEHTAGSHTSLDEFAKGMGAEYPAYQLTSRPNSPYRSANSSSINLSTQKNVRNLTEKTYSLDDPTTDSSQSYRESKLNTENVLGDSPLGKDRPESSVDEEEYKDSFDNLKPDSHQARDSHYRQNSDVSYLDEPEVITNKVEDQSEGPFEDPKEEIPPATSQTTDKSATVVPLNDAEEDEESEDIKRMKSVYRVYFDRENSIKKPTEKPQSDLPPLPQIDTETESVAQVEQEHEDEQEAEDTIPSLDPNQNSTNNFLSVNPSQGGDDEQTAAERHRAVSSIYSSIPLAQFADSPQELQQSFHPQQQQYPQAQQQRNIYQPPYAQRQQAYPQQYSQPSSPQLSYQPQFAPQPLKPLQTLPTPNKMDYNSIVTQTDYAPKKPTPSAAKPDLSIKPFNPLHYSDQIFQPTSPISPSAQQFPSQPQSFGQRDITPPSPHHIRQSIVMMNPVEIGKHKLYRPAGSFTQMNSANSSRNGSLTSQSAYTSQQTYQAPSTAELPRSGSKADLRNQLGSSDNYNFV